MTLLDELRHAGLHVHPNPGWETATNNGRDRIETVGVVNHWDAISGWPGVDKYLSDNRFGGILYHIVIRANGDLHLLSQRYAWHAGVGSGEILNIARAGGPVPDDSAGPDNMNGNPHFFGVCINYHPNDGSVPRAQYEALVTTNRVLADHFGLNVSQVFRHMDWTTRKRDIDTIDLNTFRDDIRLALGANMYRQIYEKWTAADLEAMRQQGLWQGQTSVWADDIGTYAHDWDHLTSTILAAKAKQEAGGVQLELDTVQVVKNVRLLGQ